MLDILFYALPSMMVILALYLIFFNQPLKNILQLESRKPIMLVATTYFAMAFLGFILVFFGFRIASFIWLTVVIILTGLVTWVTYELVTKKPDDWI